jgi:hypothetical protein
MAKIINVNPILTDKQADKLQGTLLPESSYNLLIDYDADVYCAVTGECIAKFRKKIIPKNIANNAYLNLLKAAGVSQNRGIASGKKRTKLRADGVISNTPKAAPVNSGIIGYFDKNPRTPYCRQTAFNQNDFDKFKKAYPIIKYVDSKYAELMPKHYKKQREIADQTTQDFVIKNTAFTTVTVNKNWQTAVHKDAGDFEEGFGNLVVLRKGLYKGGYFVVPKWGVAFDMQNLDLLLVDVHQWHGNTEITKIDEDATRISLVMYYRKKMIDCGTLDEELHNAKQKVITR